eukprot:357374-Chlamydomonas_euryale.AAC.1
MHTLTDPLQSTRSQILSKAHTHRPSPKHTLTDPLQSTRSPHRPLHPAPLPRPPLPLHPLPLPTQSLLDEVLQLSLCKFSARPHWALSTNRMLTSRCPLRLAYGAGFDVLAARRARYDPSDMFLPPLFSRIEAASPPPRFPGCALSEECFCESDEHCGPGFACSEGRVFPEYRVCRMWGNENAVEL